MLKLQTYWTALLILWNLSVTAQDDGGFHWWNPATAGFSVVEGQAWPYRVAGTFDRLPADAEPEVRPVIWRKSHETAGQLIRFKTNAAYIRVRYSTGKPLAFEHMPATGVSGVDLYARAPQGRWQWMGLEYTHGDTMQYHFKGFRPDSTREYYLYLPLYNTVQFLEIGVPEGSAFRPLPPRAEKPLVVYGTSITQGGCASRPGLAWTAILGRLLDRPVINLGFSSNGLLEPPLLELMAEIDASAFILDCLPNLRSLPPGVVKERVLAAVRQLRAARPSTPIVLADHADANIGLIDTILQHSFLQVNQVSREAYTQLLKDGVKGLYYLTSDKVGLGTESTVDGQHPNDFGMMQYAKAYQALLPPLVQPEKRPATLRSGVITRSRWCGFEREDITVAGRHCILVSPRRPAAGRPWIWRTEFFGAFAAADSMLAARGFHVAYMDITDMYGAPVALDHMDNCYTYMTKERNLHRRPVLEGFSRGGLSALNWAARRPDQVGCIYLDAAVCDFKSWPGARKTEFAADWERLKKAYGFAGDAEAMAYRQNPVDALAPIAAARIPILSVFGTADPLVPPKDNNDLLQSRYTALGGKMEAIPKPGIGHHPHSLADPTPIVTFILEHTAPAYTNHQQTKK
ncbi:SGNH/GDSL hydrolase family protein [Chitinophaga lutea]